MKLLFTTQGGRDWEDAIENIEVIVIVVWQLRGLSQLR